MGSYDSVKQVRFILFYSEHNYDYRKLKAGDCVTLDGHYGKVVKSNKTYITIHVYCSWGEYQRIRSKPEIRKVPKEEFIASRL